MDPTTASAIFSGISTAFRFAEYALRLAEVGSENEVFVRTIQVVRTDLHEAERLLQVKVVQQKLIGVPAKFSWIQSAITSTKKALHEIGKWVERARVDQESTGSVKFETRVRWVFNDHEKLANRKIELSTCHQQLSNVLNFLVPLEEIPGTSEPPTYHDISRFEDLLSPHALRQAKSCISMSQQWSLDECSTASLMHREQRRNLEPITSSALIAQSDPFMMSPPPTYAAALSSTNALPGTTKNSSLDPANLKAKSIFEPNEVSLDRKQQTWAYVNADSQESDNYIPELEDIPIVMSATNTAGPVSPFELFSNRITSKRGRLCKAPEAFDVPGGTKPPAELDANFLGHRPSQRSAGPIKYNKSVSQLQCHKSSDKPGLWERTSQCTNHVSKQTASRGKYMTNASSPRLHTTSHSNNSAPKAQICTQVSIMNMLSALEDD